MQKILFCNIDILKKGFENWDNDIIIDFREEVLELFDFLIMNGNQVVFMSRDYNKVKVAEKWCKSEGRDDFFFSSRKNVDSFIENNYDDKNQFVVIGTKDRDFYTAVNNKLLLVVPTWLPTEDKICRYGLQVDTPEQLKQLFLIINNNQGWYAELDVDKITKCISLYDARTRIIQVSDNERQMLNSFQTLLKTGSCRNYYQILLYYFLANMTRDVMFDDITIYGVMPSSNGLISDDIFDFCERVRCINKVTYPSGLKDLSPEEKNILIRHSRKPQQHGGSQAGRSQIGGVQEFSTLKLNPAYKRKIDSLRSEGRLNICIFDDYMNYGNGFNAVRCLLESIGANKIIFVSMGMFRRTFYRKDYVINGDVFSPHYNYFLENEIILSDFYINDQARNDIDYLYDVYNDL